MSNVVQRHFSDVFHYSVNIDQSIFISLDHACSPPGKLASSTPDAIGTSSKRFVLLLDTQIKKQYECDCIHDQELQFQQ